MGTTLSILIIVAMMLVVIYLAINIIDSYLNLFRKEKSDKPDQAKKEIIEAILTLKSAIDLSTTNEIAKAVERLQEAKEKKTDDRVYLLYYLENEKVESGPFKLTKEATDKVNSEGFLASALVAIGDELFEKLPKTLGGCHAGSVACRFLYSSCPRKDGKIICGDYIYRLIGTRKEEE